MMKLPIDTNVKSLFVLGAGSSVDFGLPTWNELCSMIKTEIGRNNYQYKKEIEDWLNKTGHDRKYATIDEAMAFEPDEKPYFEIGELIEDEIFQIIKKIFEESYVPNNSSWIKYLNESLLEKLVDLNKLLFINYNYDKVLDLNLLNFSFLSSKRRDYYYREQLEDIAGGSVMAIYPHGSFFKQEVSNDNLIKFVILKRIRKLI